MLINYLALGTSCAIALARPVWGIALLLVLENSLFFLGQNYAVVPLGVGYAGPMDVHIAAILLGAILSKRRSLASKPTILHSNPPLSHSRLDSSLWGRTLMFSAVAPYFVWMTACALAGILGGEVVSTRSIATRSVISNIVPWALAPAVWMVRDKYRTVLACAVGVAVLTAVVHLTIQVFDVRTVMMQAYDYGDPTAAITQYRTHDALIASVVRGIPQGSILMLYALLFCFSKCVVGASRHLRGFTALSALLLLALAITVSRSLISFCTLGCLLAIAAALALKLISATRALRTLYTLSAMGLLGLMLLVATGRYLASWQQRIEDFAADDQIFSESTVRGLNNLSAFDAIMHKSLIGYGVSDYPNSFSRAGTYHSDIHPLLGIALFGGIIAALLAIRLQWTLLVRLFRRAKYDPDRARRLLPYVVILATTLLVNCAGAGGTFESRGLIPFALFVGLVAADDASILLTHARRKLTLSVTVRPEPMALSQRQS